MYTQPTTSNQRETFRPAAFSDHVHPTHVRVDNPAVSAGMVFAGEVQNRAGWLYSVISGIVCRLRATPANPVAEVGASRNLGYNAQTWTVTHLCRLPVTLHWSRTRPFRAET